MLKLINLRVVLTPWRPHLTRFASDDSDTHFGFKTIKRTYKTKEVYEIFEAAASKYDLMVDFASLGIHRLWKDIFMCHLSPTKNTKLLDMAGGTGDIAFRFLNAIRSSNSEQGCHVTVCDISENMLEVGKKRFEKLDYDPKLISWQKADAEQLEFKENSFNAYTIGFGMRLIPNKDKVLAEAYRVLEPGGRFMCLEFGHLENETAQYIYDQYSFNVIPVITQVVGGQWQTGQLLVESVRKFPRQETFKNMMKEAGFRQVTYENLMLGVVAIYSGFKL